MTEDDERFDHFFLILQLLFCGIVIAVCLGVMAYLAPWPFAAVGVFAGGCVALAWRLSK